MRISKRTAAGAAALAVVALSGCGGGPSTVSSPSPYPQPENARQAAASLGAVGFTECGAGQAAASGVVDSGTAHWHGVRIGIDRFAGKAQRNTWVREVANFGIVPLYEGRNWVAYKAHSQHGPPCA